MATFGDTNEYSGDTSMSANSLEGLRFTAPADGYVTSVSLYCLKSSGTPRYKAVIVDSGYHIIINGISEPSDLVGSSVSWITANFSFCPLLVSGNNYILCFVPSSTITAKLYYGGPANQMIVDPSNSYDNPSDPTDWTNVDQQISLYGTYSPPSKIQGILSIQGITTIQF